MNIQDVVYAPLHLITELIANSNDGIYIFNQDGIIIAVNQKFAEIFHLNASALPGRSLQSLFPGAGFNALFFQQLWTQKAAALTVLLPGHPTSRESYQLFSDGNTTLAIGMLRERQPGKILPAIENEQYQDMVTRVTDISHLRQTEEKAGNREQSFKLTFANNPLPMWVFDLATLDFIEVNRAMTQHYGWTREELLTMKVSQIRPVEARTRFEQRIAELKDSAQDYFNSETQHLTRSGQIIDVAITSYKLTFTNRPALIVVAQDITERKRSQEALRLSEERIRFALNSSQIMLSSQDTALRYTWMLGPRFGGGIDTVLGKTDEELYPAKVAAQMSKIKQRVLDTGIRFQQEIQVPYGESLACYMLIAEPMRNAEKQITGLTCAMYDNTSFRQVEERIHYQANLLQNVSDAILATDNHYLITSWNRAAEQMYGYQAEEVIGKLSMEILKVTYLENNREQVIAALQQSGAWQGELLMQHRSGRSIRVFSSLSELRDTQGNLIGVVAVNRDITERYQSEKTMRLKDKAMYAALNAIVMLSPDYRIDYVNPAFLKMWGYESESSVTGMHLRDLFAHYDPQVSGALEHTGKWLGELSALRKDHTPFDVQVAAAVVPDKNNEPLGILFSFIDITERKQAESERQSVTEELMRSNTELKQFAYITSHNLRAPVINLSGLLNLYDRTDPLNEFNAVVIEKADESVKRLSTTLEDLLEVIAIKEKAHIKCQQLSFAAVLEEVCSSIEGQIATAEAEIRADFSECPGLYYPYGYLQSILLNLLTNAIKYKAGQRKPIIELKTTAQEKYICLSVKDNGIGIDLDRHGSRLFGLYQRFHEGAEGKGLGLYIVKSQVEALGGKIEVKSNPGEGTVFEIYFNKQRL